MTLTLREMTTTMLSSSKVETFVVSKPLSPKSVSTRSSLPPNYYDDTEIIELGTITPTTSVSTESLPKYETSHEHQGAAGSSHTAFHATRVLQIEAAGHPLVALPIPPRPYPIMVHEVLPGGEIGPQVFTSLRATRCSGNSVLIRADDSSETSLCTTTYRFGPNRPPRISLHGAASMSSNATSSDQVSIHEEEFEVVGRGCTTRSQIIRTHLGTFTWRYANRDERRVDVADSLLVLEKITTIALEGGKQEERRRRVAQLVRNKEFRTEHTSRRTAGNGGRLMIDLREWADEKGAKEQMEALTVASCLVMLKKEVDRRRLCQAMALAGAMSPGC